MPLALGSTPIDGLGGSSLVPNDTHIEVSIPSAIHDDYLASYPITFVFHVPDLPGLTGQWRADGTDPWTDLTTRTRRFDGVEAARFDGDRAYLSVPFAADSDLLQLRVIDTLGQSVGRYLGIARYYDARTSVIVCTYDDWGTGGTMPEGVIRHAQQLDLLTAHRATGLWASIGINAEYPGSVLTSAQWADMDAAIAAGHFEPINHGRTHLNGADYSTQELADSEITLGGQIISDNVTMPPQSRRGSEQRVQGWIRPNGNASTTTRPTLTADKYLSDRPGASNQVEDFRPWVDGEFYEAQPPSIRSLYTTGATVTDEEAAADAIIAHFDTVHAQGGIANVYTYAFFWPSGWGVGTHGRRWLEHIGGNDDVWAVGYGHLYQYRKITESITVTDKPAHVATATTVGGAGGGGGTDCTVTLPTGSAGDLLLAFHYYYAGTETAPSGWTLLGSDTTSTREAIWYRVADGTEGATVTFSGSDANPSFHHLSVMRYTGTDPTSPIIDHAKNVADGTTVTAPAVTGTGLAVRVLSAPGGDRVTTPPATMDRSLKRHASPGRANYSVAEEYVWDEAPSTTAGVAVTSTAKGWTVLLAPAGT